MYMYTYMYVYIYIYHICMVICPFQASLAAFASPRTSVQKRPPARVVALSRLRLLSVARCLMRNRGMDLYSSPNIPPHHGPCNPFPDPWLEAGKRYRLRVSPRPETLYPSNSKGYSNDYYSNKYCHCGLWEVACKPLYSGACFKLTFAQRRSHWTAHAATKISGNMACSIPVSAGSKKMLSGLLACPNVGLLSTRFVTWASLIHLVFFR